ncbi:interleukin-17C [Labrus mixtus]|uniref:interleukin-17C n=1 Tax=Labrus mixtus TaxID=508554 RepID=UPI0029BFE6F9|nr:interleukin-17C [Labrus mixtus]
MMDSQSKADPLDRSLKREKKKETEMDVKKILLFGLLIVPVFTSQCFNESQLEEAADRKLRRHYQQPLTLSTTKSPTEPACPVELYRNYPPMDLNGRSLSPWRQVIRTNTAFFPSTYYEAECLCSGCILIENSPDAEKRLVMSDAYNSVPIKTSRMFLKKELCKDKQTYSLTTVHVDVAVGCHCARPNLVQ